MIYAESWMWRQGSKWAERRRDRLWTETVYGSWSRSTLPSTGWAVRSLSHAAQKWCGNTSHLQVSASGSCQEKGQESHGGTPGTWQVAAGSGTMPMLHKHMLTSVEPVSPGLGYRWGGKLHSVCAGLAHTLWNPKWISTICLFSVSWTVCFIYDP